MIVCKFLPFALSDTAGLVEQIRSSFASSLPLPCPILQVYWNRSGGRRIVEISSRGFNRKRSENFNAFAGGRGNHMPCPITSARTQLHEIHVYVDTTKVKGGLPIRARAARPS